MLHAVTLFENRRINNMADMNLLRLIIPWNSVHTIFTCDKAALVEEILCSPEKVDQAFNYIDNIIQVTELEKFQVHRPVSIKQHNFLSGLVCTKLG